MICLAHQFAWRFSAFLFNSTTAPGTAGHLSEVRIEPPKAAYSLRPLLQASRSASARIAGIELPDRFKQGDGRRIGHIEAAGLGADRNLQDVASLIV